MSDSSAFDFGKFIPGFDFLQKLTASGQGAAGPVSALHNWVAPTVSVDELDKRIKELKAVQFWLEQNGTALKATIQALEVQKMTLATLAGMNLSMAEVAKAFTLPTTPPAAAPARAAADATPAEHWPFATAPAPQTAAPARAPVADPAPEPAPEAAAAPEAAPPARPAARARKPAAAAPATAPAAAGLADPMQWWGALTQQFQQIAANALRDAASAPAAGAAGNAPDAIAEEAVSTATGGQKGTKKKSSAPPARKASRKTGASAARKAPPARKAAPRKPAADQPPAQPAAKASAAGWPLPPPFKFGR